MSSSYQQTITQVGPAGGSISATDFSIQPKTGAAASRIHRVRLSSSWAVDEIQVQYENPATNPPEFYTSEAFGGRGGNVRAFSLAAGDYLTFVSGTWGAQAPGYPREEIISLQFHTHKGNQSQVFGGGNPEKQVESFTLVAPQGSEIIGFFGAYGSNQNVLVRLGIYTRPVQSAPVVSSVIGQPSPPATAPPNISPSPPVPAVSSVVEQPSQPATAPPNVAPSPPAPAVSSVVEQPSQPATAPPNVAPIPPAPAVSSVIGQPSQPATAPPNVAPSPSAPAVISVVEQPSQPATAPPNVAPSPPAPAVSSVVEQPSPPATALPNVAPSEPAVTHSRQKIFLFDQNHQGIAVGRGALRPQGEFTIEAWVYPATDAGKQVIYAEGETRFYLEGSELKFQPTPTAPAIASVGASLVAGSW